MSMEALTTLRTKWADVEAEETRLIRAMTVGEGLRELAMLYTAYASNLQADTVEQAERTAALLECQRRLARLATWLRLHPTALVETDS
jgi:hypothetical protein